MSEPKSKFTKLDIPPYNDPIESLSTFIGGGTTTLKLNSKTARYFSQNQDSTVFLTTSSASKKIASLKPIHNIQHMDFNGQSKESIQKELNLRDKVRQQ